MRKTKRKKKGGGGREKRSKILPVAHVKTLESSWLSHTVSSPSESPVYAAFTLDTKFNYFLSPQLLPLWTKGLWSLARTNEKAFKPVYLGREDPLEKEMATHSSMLAWRIPWTTEPGGYCPRGRMGLDMTWWLTATATTYFSTCQSDHVTFLLHILQVCHLHWSKS